MPHQNSSGAGSSPAVRRKVEELLSASQSFRHLDAPTQEALTDALAQVTDYLGGANPGAALAHPLAGQMSPASDLQRKMQQGAAPAGSPAPSPGQTQPASGAPAAGGSPGQSTTGRVGEVARATLNAIDFPSFVAGLIQGTFQAIVDASIQQMEAYAELLKNVSRTVDQFMSDNISEDTAKDYLADRYDGLIVRDTSAGAPKLRVNGDGNGEMPSFFKDLGFSSPADIDDEAMEQKVVPAARRSMAEQRQQTLATMVLMGINRIVVKDGEIAAKLVFHIDASETTNIRFDQSKTTGGNMAGKAARNQFTANGIMVNTSSLNAQSDINVRADLTGSVKVHFMSETFPLERFADSAAIQLINQNAKVPQPLPAAPAAADGAPAVAVAPKAAAPPPAPATAPAQP
ncbi:MAG: hypothetical protein ACJ754_19255, partial [Pyrinomonadaceae bacterium]